MKLTDEWFTQLSSTDDHRTIVITGRTGIDAFRQSGKLPERVEVLWRFAGEDGMPSEELSQQMEQVEAALRQTMEKDKLAILTGIYTGGGERCWVFYTRKVAIFSQYLNEALADFPPLPLELSAEYDPDWEEYLDMRGEGDADDDESL